MAQIGGGQNRLKADSHFKNSHTLPKIAISLALLFGGANVAFAEESGGFVGIGVGYGDAKMIIESSAIDESQTFKYKSNGASYGFIAGYKQFFNDYLGLRYYANVDLTHASFDLIDPEFGTATNKFNTILVNYGVNVDFLGNFVVTGIADFGGFIGLGIGGNTWTGKDIKDMKNNKEAGDKFNDTSFDVALNVGLRTNIAKYHGIELAVRVPFLKTQIIKGNTDGVNYKYELGQNVRVLARYTFSF